MVNVIVVDMPTGPANLTCSKAPHLNHHKQIKDAEHAIINPTQNAGGRPLGYELWQRV